MTKKIVISGGNGRLSREIGKASHDANNPPFIFDLVREYMDITSYDSVMHAVSCIEPDYFIHAAALTKPLSAHNTDIAKSIDANIIGTANVVKACWEKNIKLIYISTDYVYPKESIDVDEQHPVKPFTNYGWSKLGGECAVAMYPNSLILRGAFFETPFPYSHGYTNIFKNQLYQNESAKIILQLLDETGVINIGSTKVRSLFDFAKDTKPDVLPAICTDNTTSKNMILNINKMNYILKNKEKI